MRTFDEALGLQDIIARQRRNRKTARLLRTVGCLLIVFSLALIAWLIGIRWVNAQSQSDVGDTAVQRVAGWSPERTEQAWKVAQAYNRELARSGQGILGEAVDPFTAMQHSHEGGLFASAATKDKKYQSLLNISDGVMGRVRIPKISVDLPIYHGTAKDVLAKGAGHLYGTSLPVGGRSTHAVVTGHRGLVQELMFTRLDEMKQGDVFYIDVLDQTLAYQVDDISIIEPNDASKLKVQTGQDRFTLMTCTPYGINTHRLLVSGHRVPLQSAARTHDARQTAIAVTLLISLLGCFGVLRWNGKRFRAMRHGGTWPRRW